MTKRDMHPAQRAVTVAVVATFALLGARGATAHDPHHTAPPTQAIDPRVRYPAGIVSGGGGHFHAILAVDGLHTLFAGTHLGLFRSGDQGRTWRLAESRFSGDDVHAVVAGRDAIYVATHAHGLLASRDGGAHWRDESRGLPGRDLHALAVDPAQVDTIYVWVVGHGLFRRSGPRRRWEHRAARTALADVQSLAIDPRDHRRLYAGTAAGVWLSEDGGARWRRPANGLARQTAGVAVSPAPPQVLLAATLDGVFAGNPEATDWKPVAAAAPAWWGPLIAFVFIEGGSRLLGVSHEGVVATHELAGNGGWVPLAGRSTSGHRE